MDTNLEKLLEALSKIQSEECYMNPNTRANVFYAAREYLLNGDALIAGRVSTLARNGYKLDKVVSKNGITVAIKTTWGNIPVLTKAPAPVKIKASVDMKPIKDKAARLTEDSDRIAASVEAASRTSLKEDVTNFFKGMFGGFFR